MSDDALDAARYRWLRSRPTHAISGGGLFIGQTPQNVVLTQEDADAAIDKAMAQEEAWWADLMTSSAMKASEAYLIPHLDREVGESWEAYDARRAAGSVRVFNIGPNLGD